MINWRVRQFTNRKRREHSQTNQDSKHVGKNGVFILADGVGGEHGGKLASESAVLQTRLKLDDMLSLLGHGFMSTGKIEARLTQYINEAHQSLRAMPRAGQGESAMQTTLDVCLVYEDVAYTAHVGDSRVYLLRGSDLQQITEDKELYLGMETRKGAEGKEVIPVSTGQLPLQEGDVLAMLTDGVTKYLMSEQLRAYLMSFGSEHNVAQKIVSAARNPEHLAKERAERDGKTYLEALRELKAKDDETAIIVKFGGK